MINHNESFSNIGLNLKATYTQLPEILFSKLMPISVKDPKTVVLNNELSSELGIDFSDYPVKTSLIFYLVTQYPVGLVLSHKHTLVINLEILQFLVMEEL